MSNGTMVWGDKRLNPSVEILLGVNDELSFQVDGATYAITLDPNVYLTDKPHMTSELVTHINEKLNAVSCPVQVRLGGVLLPDGTTSERHIDVLVLEHTDTTASHSINFIQGSAVNTIFGNVFDTTPNKP